MLKCAKSSIFDIFCYTVVISKKKSKLQEQFLESEKPSDIFAVAVRNDKEEEHLQTNKKSANKNLASEALDDTENTEPEQCDSRSVDEENAIEDTVVAQEKPKTKKTRFIILGVVIIILAAATIGIVVYFNTHTLPGVKLAGEEISGLGFNELDSRIAEQASTISIMLVNGDEKLTPTTQELGISYDFETTKENLIGAKAVKNIFEMIDPTDEVDIPLVVKYDDAVLQSYLNQHYYDQGIELSDARLSYNDSTKEFDVIAGKGGRGVKAEDVAASFPDIFAGHKDSQIVVNITDVEPIVSEESAKETKTQADKKLKDVITIDAQGVTKYTFTPWDIASFLSFTTDVAKGKLDLSVNQDAISAFVGTKIQPLLTTEAVAKKILIDENTGADLEVMREGVDGKSPKDPQEIVKQVQQSLESETDANITAELVVQPFEQERTDFDDRKWIEANLSTYCVTLHSSKGDEQVTCNTAKGKADTPTITGEFDVYEKRVVSCMPNPPSEEPLCDIHWQTYWGPGGYAFHEAWWLTKAKLKTGISHGCINMYKDDAKKVYDFAQVGTRVVVHY
ncbi:peptidase [Actinomycetota bacterium]|nr:peptidase [Actinomycetota bacterium]